MNSDSQDPIGQMVGETKFCESLTKFEGEMLKLYDEAFHNIDEVLPRLDTFNASLKVHINEEQSELAKLISVEADVTKELSVQQRLKDVIKDEIDEIQGNFGESLGENGEVGAEENFGGQGIPGKLKDGDRNALLDKQVAARRTYEQKMKELHDLRRKQTDSQGKGTDIYLELDEETVQKLQEEVHRQEASLQSKEGELQEATQQLATVQSEKYELAVNVALLLEQSHRTKEENCHTNIQIERIQEKILELQEDIRKRQYSLETLEGFARDGHSSTEQEIAERYGEFDCEDGALSIAEGKLQIYKQDAQEKKFKLAEAQYHCSEARKNKDAAVAAVSAATEALSLCEEKQIHLENELLKTEAAATAALSLKSKAEQAEIVASEKYIQSNNARLSREEERSNAEQSLISVRINETVSAYELSAAKRDLHRNAIRLAVSHTAKEEQEMVAIRAQTAWETAVKEEKTANTHARNAGAVYRDAQEEEKGKEKVQLSKQDLLLQAESAFDSGTSSPCSAIDAKSRVAAQLGEVRKAMKAVSEAKTERLSAETAKFQADSKLQAAKAKTQSAFAVKERENSVLQSITQDIADLFAEKVQLQKKYDDAKNKNEIDVISVQEQEVMFDTAQSNYNAQEEVVACLKEEYDRAALEKIVKLQEYNSARWESGRVACLVRAGQGDVQRLKEHLAEVAKTLTEMNAGYEEAQEQQLRLEVESTQADELCRSQGIRVSELRASVGRLQMRAEYSMMKEPELLERINQTKHGLKAREEILPERLDELQNELDTYKCSLRSGEETLEKLTKATQEVDTAILENIASITHTKFVVERLRTEVTAASSHLNDLRPELESSLTSSSLSLGTRQREQEQDKSDMRQLAVYEAVLGKEVTDAREALDRATQELNEQGRADYTEESLTLVAGGLLKAKRTSEVLDIRSRDKKCELDCLVIALDGLEKTSSHLQKSIIMSELYLFTLNQTSKGCCQLRKA